MRQIRQQPTVAARYPQPVQSSFSRKPVPASPLGFPSWSGARILAGTLTVAGLWLSVAGLAFGQYQPSSLGLVRPDVARHAGLKRAWYARAEVDRARGRLAHITPHVSATEAHTVFEVTYDGGELQFSQRQLDPFGRPVGVEGAKKLAEEKMEELKANKLNPKLVTHVIPRSTLYLATDRAMIQALDAETGRTRWLQRVGKRDYPTLAVGANETSVAVVNGSTLFVLDAATGKLQWQRTVTNVPGAGPAVSEELVFVPMINGTVEAYYLNDYLRAPYIFASHGRAIVQPTVTAASVAWPTDVGHVYVGRANERGIRYRLEANRTIVSRVAALPPTSLFVTSVDGFVYAIQEVSGQIIWRFSTGEPISQAAVAIGDSVYLQTDSGGMFCLAADTGLERWWTPNVRGFLSASQDRVYVVGELGEIVILDRESGGKIASIPASLHDHIPITNGLTDRIYLASPLGIVQCLHEQRNQFPVLHVEAAEKQQERPQVIQQGPAQPQQPGPQQPQDPFGGGGQDPFGGGAKDPFGGGGGAAADPFGGGGAAGGAAADPFGGGGAGGGAAADPFGGGGNANPFD